EIAPAAVAVESHGEAPLMARAACALDAHDAGFAARALHGIGLHHGVVLLVDPALGADVGAGQKLFEIADVIAILLKVVQNLFGRLLRNGCLPYTDGAVIERSVIGQGFVGNVGNENAVMANAEAGFRLDGSN